MDQILVEKHVSGAKLDVYEVYDWPTWEKEQSTFPWKYDQSEICYILEGKAIVTPEGGEPVTIERGDLVTFPKGMSCTWEVVEPISKHYNFTA